MKNKLKCFEVLKRTECKCCECVGGDFYIRRNKDGSIRVKEAICRLCYNARRNSYRKLAK